MKRMTQWLWLYLDEIKGGFKFLLLLLVIVAIRHHAQLLEWWQRTQLEGETTAVIIDKQTIEYINESEMGGRVMVKAYEVSYSYGVEEKQFAKKAFLDRRRYNMQERILLRKLQVGDTVQLKYDLEDFEHAKLKLN